MRTMIFYSMAWYNFFQKLLMLLLLQKHELYYGRYSWLYWNYLSVRFYLRILILPEVKILSVGDELPWKKKVMLSLCHEKLNVFIKHGRAQKEGFLWNFGSSIFCQLKPTNRKHWRILLYVTLSQIIYSVAPIFSF